MGDEMVSCVRQRGGGKKVVTFDDDDFCVEFFFEGFAFGGFLPGIVVIYYV